MPNTEIATGTREDSQIKTIRHMIEQETKRIAKGKSEWPGLPLSHIPLIWTAAFRAMVRSGEIEIVERPRTHRPGTVDYVRFTADHN